MAEETRSKRAPSRLDQLRDAERRLREAELELVLEKTRNVKLENELQAAQYAVSAFDYREMAAKDDRNRTYNFVEDVNWVTSTKALVEVSAWARISPDPIVVRFNSPGGSVYDGLALYDQLKAIDLHRAPIITVSLGMSASMAGVLMQAGSRRIVSQNTQFMIHEVSTVAWGKTSDIEDEAKLTRKLNDRLFNILASRSQQALKAGTAKEGLTLEKVWERAKRKDWWLDAEEAVYYGFADEIGYL